MVWLMRSKEAHHSVNLKENSRTDIWCSSRQTKEREIERASERGWGGIQSRAKSALLWDGEAGLERGLRCSLTVEPAFIRYIILLGLHTSIDISSSASHQSLAVMPAYSVSNKINAYTHSVCVWGNRVTVSWQYLLYVKLTPNSISCLTCHPVEIVDERAEMRVANIPLLFNITRTNY